jgi:cell wall-associated NlpC family hydrolase
MDDAGAARPPATHLHRIARLAVGTAFAALVLSGCATITSLPFHGGPPGPGGTGAAAERPPDVEVRSDDLSSVQEQVVESARSLVGRRNLRVNGRRFRFDCTGTILAAYYGAGIDLQAEFSRYTGNGVARLFKLAADHDLVYTGDSPNPGDVIFWDNTYDRNGDGAFNDQLTHAGVVIRAYEDGSVDYVHHNYRDGIVIARMSLGAPDVHRSEAALVNSPMRMKSHRYMNPAEWLASHLYRSAGMLYQL